MSYSTGPNFRWWIPADGIRRDVITADIQRYLGPEAVVRPGEGRDRDQGHPGYWIAAYRTFTPEMIRDLKADSANFERSGDRGAYQDSMIHRSRQHWGPTGSTPAPQVPATEYQSRPESTSTTYSRSTNSTYESSSGYPASSYDYNSGGRGERDPEPSRVQREPYSQGYPPVQNTGYPPTGYTQQPGYSNASPGVAGRNYTHQPSTEQSTVAPTHPSYAQHPEYARPYDYAQAAPRSEQYQTPQTSQHPGYSTHAQPSSNTHPSASRNPRPGYYLASDGNYYPESSRPSAT